MARKHPEHGNQRARGGGGGARQLVRAALIATLLACGAKSTPPTVPPPTTPPAAPPSEPAGERTAVAHEPFSLEVLGLEPLVDVSPANARVAERMTALLLAAAREDRAIRLGHSHRQLVDEKLMAGCETEAKSCMLAIAKQLRADAIIYGHSEPRGPVYHLTIELLHVRSEILLSWTGTVQDAEPDLQAAAKAAFQSLVGRAP